MGLRSYEITPLFTRCHFFKGWVLKGVGGVLWDILLVLFGMLIGTYPLYWLVEWVRGKWLDHKYGRRNVGG